MAVDYTMPSIKTFQSTDSYVFDPDPYTRYNVKIYIYAGTLNNTVTFYDSQGQPQAPVSVTSGMEIVAKNANYRKVTFADAASYPIYMVIQRAVYSSDTDLTCIPPSVDLSISPLSINVNIASQLISQLNVNIAAQSVGNLAVNLAAITTTANLNVAIASSAVTLQVNIASQSANLNVNLAAQSLGTVAISINALNVTGNLPVNIAAQSVGNLAVNIAAQSVGNLATNLAAITTTASLNVAIASSAVTLNVNITSQSANVAVTLAAQSITLNTQGTVPITIGVNTYQSIPVSIVAQQIGNVAISVAAWSAGTINVNLAANNAGNITVNLAAITTATNLNVNIAAQVASLNVVIAASITASGKVFNSNLADTVVTDNFVVGAGSWSIASYVLSCTATDGSRIWLKNTFDNFEMTVRTYSAGGGRGVILFRAPAQGGTMYTTAYVVMIGANVGGVHFLNPTAFYPASGVSSSGYGPTTAAETISTSTWNYIKIRCNGSHIQVWFSTDGVSWGNPIFDVYDTTYSSGYIGFGNQDNTESNFSQITVVPLDPTANFNVSLAAIATIANLNVKIVASEVTLNVSVSGTANVNITASSITLTVQTALLSSAYGNGSDGVADLNGTNTYAWASKSGSTYTLTRTVQATNFTVESGVTLDVSGYQVLCSGTFTNYGTVTDGYCGGAGGAAVSDSGFDIAGNPGSNGVATHYSAIVGGGGGGSGAIHVFNAVNSTSGAGGKGGGVVWIAAPYLLNYSVINANGANGGSGSVVAPNGGGAGGGGGGGAGTVQLVYHYVIVAGEVTTQGGNAGNGANYNAGGTLLGGAGGAGSVAGGLSGPDSNNVAGQSALSGLTGGGGGGGFSSYNNSSTFLNNSGGLGGSGAIVQSVA